MQTTQPASIQVRALASIASLQNHKYLNLPLVDFQQFVTGTRRDKRVCSDAILKGLREEGFLYLTGHGLDQAQIDHVFQQSKWFFNLSMAEKNKLAWQSPEANRGYVAPGREKVSQLKDPKDVAQLRTQSPDLKESLEIGREPSPNNYVNNWPKNPEFKKTMMEFFESAHLLHLEIMNALALSLNLGNRFFDEFCGAKDHNLRLLHYPAVPKNLLDKDGHSRAGAHSDYGTLTLLFQDDKGGLEVKDKHTDQWVPVHPIPGTIVINAGDLLARWANDTITSTEHRVVSPQTSTADKNSYDERYSVVFFCNPNFDAEIKVLPSCSGKTNPPRYEPVNTHRYLTERLSTTY
ncbi:hypothetical protein SmJEL517_g05526 [Synchytrium microbalum]|uniref:Fe2OG dioxygenase domain-containing protein n=1 Tax=Synchytrium microbalum TaxID=1806994 RepID=A0A507BV80_9FUNG|nr:uncharacterized protein SmJEL517_g05526 [Synchytrium microbalum]TPX31081.1 hypothetical protein SmJEL517_g05526 [Synchytrium microbalum]